MGETAANGKPGASRRSENTQALALCFGTADTHSTSDVGTAVRGQLCPCCLWTAGDAGLSKDRGLRAQHPATPAGPWPSLARGLSSALLSDAEDTALSRLCDTLPQHVAAHARTGRKPSPLRGSHPPVRGRSLGPEAEKWEMAEPRTRAWPQRVLVGTRPPSGFFGLLWDRAFGPQTTGEG